MTTLTKQTIESIQAQHDYDTERDAVAARAFASCPGSMFAKVAASTKARVEYDASHTRPETITYKIEIAD